MSGAGGAFQRTRTASCCCAGSSQTSASVSYGPCGWRRSCSAVTASPPVRSTASVPVPRKAQTAASPRVPATNSVTSCPGAAAAAVGGDDAAELQQPAEPVPRSRQHRGFAARAAEGDVPAIASKVRRAALAAATQPDKALGLHAVRVDRAGAGPGRRSVAGQRGLQRQRVSPVRRLPVQVGLSGRRTLPRRVVQGHRRQQASRVHRPVEPAAPGHGGFGGAWATSAMRGAGGAVCALGSDAA